MKPGAKEKWQLDASDPCEYHYVEARRGREFLLRMTTGTDIIMALTQFGMDKDIRFAKVHAAFMGGLQPAILKVWTPDPRDPSNWHTEMPATIHNLSMILSMSGMISIRSDGKTEKPYAVAHIVIGGGWDVPTIGGHLMEGSIVKGVLEVFITELLDIDVIVSPFKDQMRGSENWYKEVK